MTPQLLDHVFAIALAAAVPYFGMWEYRRLKSRLAAGDRAARVHSYAITLAVEWGLAFVAVALWLMYDRDVNALGLGAAAGGRAWIGFGIVLVVMGLITAQSVATLRDRDKLAEVVDQLASMEALIPRDAREWRIFKALSVTAGICEELLYRGYLMAYFGAFFNTWVAVLLSSVVFGIAHAYQGRGGIIKTGIIGLVFAALYVLTGSLWAPMILHAFIDISSGRLGRRALAG